MTSVHEIKRPSKTYLASLNIWLQKLSDHFVKNRVSSFAIPRRANGQDYMSRLMVLSLCFVAYGALL